jgi:hypothetical protein
MSDIDADTIRWATVPNFLRLIWSQSEINVWKGDLERRSGKEIWKGDLERRSGKEIWKGDLERRSGKEIWKGINPGP